MPDASPPTRVHYAIATMDALRERGASRPGEIFDWLEANGRVREADRRELASGGPRWKKETYFAAMMLVRAGLLDRRQRGVWRPTVAGLTVVLTPKLAAMLLDATGGGLGKLSLERSYAAIREAARRRRFISYADVAKVNGVSWASVRHLVPRLLGHLMTIAHARGWPLLSAAVVGKDTIGTGALQGAALDGFVAAARSLGYPVADPGAFLREQQQSVFEWAQTAPERLEAEGRSDGADEQSDFGEADEEPAPAAPAEVGRQYWIGGALWSGVDDQMERFRTESLWQSGDDEQAQLIAQMRPGDRIAIKAAFVRKHGLPFEAGGQPVSAMRIKATGTVVANRGDGRTVDVRWDPATDPRDWYFYTFRKTLARLDPQEDHARRLIAFIFGGADQDYDWWLRLPYFAGKYGVEAVPPIPLPDEAGEPEGAEEEPQPDPPYGVREIVAEGCFIDHQEIEAMLDLLRVRKNLVLQGPPGTGKSWLAKRLGMALIGSTGSLARDRLRVVQFHPSMSYEDFVRGWRPSREGKLKLRDGVFLDAVEAARASPEPFVLVVEEVNRGNPAQIFGELLTLIEDSKRRPEEGIELAYPAFPGERIYVPDNLHLIGTMNVADRSLALVDLALRRRFAFVSLSPRLGPSWRRWAAERGLDEDLLALIEGRIDRLNDVIAEDRSLGPHFRIGHSYVTPNAAVADGLLWYRQRVETEIVPLLDEYWYDQHAKVEEARDALLAPR